MIEIIMVLVVIGVVAGLAFPSYLKWMPNIALKSAARDLYANMQKAKVQAIKENKEWAVVFNSGNDSYSLCDDPGADTNWSTMADNHVVETISLAGYRYGVKFGHGAATLNVQNNPFTDNVTYIADTVHFTPQGFADNLGYVYLENEKQESAFAIGTPTFGTLALVRWRGGHTWE